MVDLLFDPYTGASGDMILGCLLDLGASLDEVNEAVESVGCRLEVFKQETSHISAIKAQIYSEKRYHDLAEARSILIGSNLEGLALKMALQALELLADAESLVHGADKEEATFHEIGSLDALADIAGSCAALQSLSVDNVYSLPISVGNGVINSDHGLLPIPGPATLEILRSSGIPWRGGPAEQELLTPTGASLLAVMVKKFFLEYPLLRIERVGYGAGSRKHAKTNILRGSICHLEHPLTIDHIVQLETNVDDVTGEVLGHLVDLLMEAGVLDVSVIPTIMKKGRSGNVIRAIIEYHDLEKISKLIMKETGSLGIRIFPSIHRFIARRESKIFDVEIGTSTFQVSVKVSWMNNEILAIKPEYEDCRNIATRTGLALREVMKRVDEVVWNELTN
jgi:uncharacterized protein (TIGR00299 family) protein